MSNVNKSIEITDAKIQFVSLVDRAANLKKFLLTKAENGSAGFQTNGRIVKVDSESHYVTGVVYEPMVADAHDNFMTEAEIEKAAHWFMKNGDKIDIQHSFEEAEGLTVVESSVTKADQEIDGQAIKKGTWLMTVEVANDDVWTAIEKGEITGLSMGGVGKYAAEDVQLEKADDAAAEPAKDSVPEKLNLLERLAKALGVESAVVKGEMRERYEKTVRSEKFWAAFNTLEGILRRWDYWTDSAAYETDEGKIREALEEFNEIIVEILEDDSGTITKQLHDAHPTAAEETGAESVEKAGRKMSKANKDKLNGIAQQLIDFAKEFDDEPEAAQDDKDEPDSEEPKTEEKEETEMNKDEIQKMIKAEIAKAISGLADGQTATVQSDGLKRGTAEAVQKAAAPAEQPAEAQVEKQTEKAEELNAETVQKMIDAAIEKAVKPVEKEAEPAPEALTADSVQKMIEETVAKAFKQRGLAASMDDGSTGNVEKSEPHYLHGIL